MTDAKEDMKQRYMSAEDKAAVKRGVKTGCQKCKQFGQKFSELIFIVALIAASALQIIWAFVVADEVLNSFWGRFCTIIKVVHMLGCAALVFLSWRNNQKVLFFFGFFQSTTNKTFFYLFCATMIFPIDFPIEDVSEGAKASSEWKFMFQFLAGSLTVLALILLFGIFCDKKNGTDDTNDDIAMMDENGATIDSSNLL